MSFDWTEIFIAVLGIISAIITHLLTKRKYRTETDGNYIENISNSLDYYEKWVDSTNKRLDEVLKNQDKLMDENSSLKRELAMVKEQTTRMSSLLCTNLPCTQRVQDSSVIDCIYFTDKKGRKNSKSTKNATKDKLG